MLDLRLIREESDRVRGALARKGVSDAAERVDEILSRDLTRREAIGEVNELKATRNEASKRIGELKRAGESADDLVAEMRRVGDRIGELDGVVAEAEARIDEIVMGLPNLPLDEVQDGGEDDGDVLRTWGDPLLPGDADFELQPHWDLGERLGILDLQAGAKVSGSGFPVLVGEGARLQRALINAMLDLHVREHGYREVRVPYLVNRDSLTGTGQLPKFEEDLYITDRDDLGLIPTAEVPVTNLRRDEILSAEDLPTRYTAYSPCFRREAGAAGKDTRGLLRVHQFDKVELVRYETPERSREALDELTAEAEKVLQILGLPYRVLRLAAGDLGFSSAMTYDLEVWAPGVDRWLEVSSCSVFTDFQSRRAGIRYRPSQSEKPRFVHTLNGSALALPRLMVALLETYQQNDGSVVFPDEVRRFTGMDGLGVSS
jgi:seryl-tRNA synthetase